MLVKCLFLALLTQCLALKNCTREGGKTKNLTIQLQVSQSSGDDYSGYIPAVELALHFINSNSCVLPDYYVNFSDIIDPECTGTPAVHGFIQHVTSRSETEILIIGPECSVSSQPVANLAPFWNLVQIATTSTSPRLSDKNSFPTFLRPVPSDTSIAPGIVKLMQHFDWKHIAIITQEEDIFTLTRDALNEEVTKQGFNIIQSVSFPTDQNLQPFVQKLQESSGRIIFLNSYEKYALEILCQASTLGMVPPTYAWITYGWYQESFWKQNRSNGTSYQHVFDHCSREQIMNIINQMILIHNYPRYDERYRGNPIIGNLSFDQFRDMLNETWNKRYTLNTTREHDLHDALYGYDAMWLAALAMDMAETKLERMNSNLTLGDFTYTGNDSSMIKDAIYSSALEVTFTGASGLLKLLPNGDRAPELRYFQYRLNSRSEGVRQLIGEVDENDDLVFSSQVIPVFTGGTPRTHEHKTVAVELFITYSILSGMGIVFAVICLVFNLVFRKKMIVRLSSPNLNVVFIVGIMLVYLLVVLFGIDSNLVPTWVVSGLCQTTLWLGVIAFTLVYGSILAQTFRVFYILRNIKVAQNKDKIKTIKEWHLFLLIGVILLIDVLFLLPVTAVPSAVLKSVLVQLPHNGELPQEVTVCSSDTSRIWFSILLVYKAFKLVFSLILAFETRKVKVKELNDSKMIVFCVYTFVVSAIALIPTSLLLYKQPAAQYAVTGIVSLLTATVLLAITFVPKMYSLYKNPSGAVNLDFSNMTINLSGTQPRSSDVSKDRNKRKNMHPSCGTSEKGLKKSNPEVEVQSANNTATDTLREEKATVM